MAVRSALPRWSLIGLVAVGVVVAGMSVALLRSGTPTRSLGTERGRRVLPNAEDRNSARQGDLTSIENALAEFKAKKGGYPSTGGKLQSLCFYDGLDAGCQLKEIRGDLPFDPLGKHNGYWYISDGRNFTLLADWEGSSDPR